MCNYRMCLHQCMFIINYILSFSLHPSSQQDAMFSLLSSINANRQACPLFSCCCFLKKIWMICCWTQEFCMNAFPVSRRDMRPRCRLICVHFSSGKGKGAAILWETPVCLLRSPTINPAELKAGHHTDSIGWGGWQNAPWLPGYWLCFYLCALNWSEWGRESKQAEFTQVHDSMGSKSCSGWK